MAYFEYKNKKVFYEEYGEGTPLLLLHGNLASSKMFSDIWPEYMDTYKVIVIDFVGYGESDRVASFEDDLWFDQAMQVIGFLREKQYSHVDIIGAGGGALVAVNVALEAPELVSKIIADCLPGEHANPETMEKFGEFREMSKYYGGATMFYESMHGEDWEQVMNADTAVMIAHAKNIKEYFHKPIEQLQAQILLIGSEDDVFVSQGHYDTIFTEIINKIKNGKKYIFERGNYPTILSNQKEFIRRSKEFLME